MTTTATRPRPPIAALEPRLEERRKLERRSVRRRRLKRAAVVVAIVGLLAVAWVVLHSGLLSVKTVAVRGVAGAERARVLAASGLGSHPPLIDVNPGAVSARVERQLPTVLSVRVDKAWPDRVVMTVVLRRPVAIVERAGGGWAVVDRTGRVLSVRQVAPPGLARLSVVAPAGAAGSSLGAGARPALEVAAALPPALAGQVATVTGVGRDRVDLKLTSPLTVALGAPTELQQKFEDAASILAAGSFAPGDVIDVTVPDSPLVETPPGA